MGASAAAGHGVGCWHLHLMPSGQGAPFRSAAAGSAAVTGTAPAGGKGRDSLVRWGKGGAKTAVLQSTERKGCHDGDINKRKHPSKDTPKS